MSSAEPKTAALEARLQELEQITQALEQGHLSLDDAIAAYAKGMKLAVSCRQTLAQMEQKVRIVRQQLQAALPDTADNSKAGDAS